jgi:hypothetical protein
MSSREKDKDKAFIFNKLHAVIIESDSSDKPLAECYNGIRDLVREEKRIKYDSHLRKGINRGTS